MKPTINHLLLAVLCSWPFAWMQAQQPQFSHQHGFYDQPFSLTISAAEGQTVRYTTDGSEPTTASQLYTAPINIKGTTILRAVAFDAEQQPSAITTATYLYVNDILKQSDAPAGYPDTWGAFTELYGTAPADYGMDPDMTNDQKLRSKIAEGLKSLPVLSIVTDKENLFSHENDSVKGGIYIFTGPPVGDGTGHGWTRPASVEMFEATANGSDALQSEEIDFSTSCGLRLHGGHGRLAEKNPKHSFRLVFKEKYGSKTLKYPLFGPDGHQKFDQLILRCHFGYSWQHWDENNRQKAQYTRDVWARRMQRRLGHTSVDALYVNLFLNGMYWGLYNIAERVDDQFGKDCLGGKKSDIDVVKIEESGGNHIEASEGTIDSWQRMTGLAAIVGGAQYVIGDFGPLTPDQAYEVLSDSLLDIDGFIDYMIINQYGGNTDWDHHNWYALRRRGEDSQGFRFLCWDTELIFLSEQENVLGKNNGYMFPTGIFQNLLNNDDFARRYVRRAKELLADDGQLGTESVVEVWDSLYNVINKALYAEAARWGDYRRDVHQYTSKGQLYTVDGYYTTERNRLLTQYFPYRSNIVLSQITNYVGIDDFEAPDGWERMMAQMFHEWDGTGIDAQPTENAVAVDWHMGGTVGGGNAVAGFVNVEYNRFADLSDYDYLVIRGSGTGLRVLANRLEDHGEYKELVVDLNENNRYWNDQYGCIMIPLADIRNSNTSRGNVRNDDFMHLHALKVNWGNSASVKSVWLIPTENPDAIDTPTFAKQGQHRVYDLQGRPVDRPTKGIYIVNGKKVVIR